MINTIIKNYKNKDIKLINTIFFEQELEFVSERRDYLFTFTKENSDFDTWIVLSEFSSLDIQLYLNNK
mgnify:CR=1 FL=1